MNQDAAETLALSALAHIAADPSLLDRFMAASGLDAAALRHSVGDPGFLAGVLDFLMSDEAALIGFCEASSVAHDAPGHARALLPGAAPDW